MLGLDTRFILFGIFVGISSYLLSTSSVSLLNFTPGKATTLWSLTHSLHHREPIVGNHDPNEKSDPLPVDALSPARKKAFEREEERRKALFYGWTKYRGRKPVYFLSHGEFPICDHGRVALEARSINAYVSLPLRTIA